MSYENFYPVRIEWKNFPEVTTPLDEINLNKMDYALYKIAEMLGDWYNSKANTVDLNTQTGRIDTLEATKANQSDLNTQVSRINSLYDIKANQSDLLQDIKSVEYNSTTGVWKFTHQNGAVNTFDQNVEKIPVSFSMSPQGVITMRTADGTTYTADIGALIKLYTFKDSSVIDFTTTTDSSGNKTITANIINGSITEEKLQPKFLSDCKAAQTASANSAKDSEAYAVGKRGGVDVPSSDVAYHNNSKHYAQQASTSATIANTSANTASTKADEASISATTASTKASEASTSATSASNSATTATTKANEATSSANEAIESATNANEYALKSEGYALGTQGNIPVSSDSPYFNKNSKHYCDVAESSAQICKDKVVQSQSILDEATHMIGASTIRVDYVTGNLIYENDEYYNFNINTTTGNLEWEAVS